MQNHRSSLSLALGLVLAAALPAQEHFVSTLEELKQAMGSDRTIVLEPGEYSSPERLTFTGIRNLRLVGRDRARTRIHSSEAYDDVVRFVDSSNVTVSSLTMGHAPEVAYCTGGVLFFLRSSDIRVEDVTLFGSGVEGITLDQVQRAEIVDSEIRECTSSVMTVARSKGVVVRNLLTRENEAWEALFNVHSSEVTLEDMKLSHVAGDAVDLLRIGGQYFYIGDETLSDKDGASEVLIQAGRIAGKVRLPAEGTPGLTFRGVDTSGVTVGPSEGPEEGPEGEPEEPDAGCEDLRLELGARAQELEAMRNELQIARERIAELEEELAAGGR